MPQRPDNAHTRRRQLAPARIPTSSFLPIDMPPITSRLPASALLGLEWEFDAGTILTPVPRPWTPYQSEAFPDVHGSNVGPAAIKPRYGYSVNYYSPVAHRRGGVLMEANPALPVGGQGFTGAGRGRGRPWGSVTPYPPANPAWRSIFGNAMLDGT